MNCIITKSRSCLLANLIIENLIERMNERVDAVKTRAKYSLLADADRTARSRSSML